jgi:hypothetical protein
MGVAKDKNNKRSSLDEGSVWVPSTILSSLKTVDCGATIRTAQAIASKKQSFFHKFLIKK